MSDLSAIARNIATASSLAAGVVQLQRDIRKLLRVTDALCVWIDWPRRSAWSVTGKLGAQVEELVIDVAGSGRRELINNTLIEPIGRCPTRAAFALRRSPGSTFGATELAMIATFAAGIAPTLDRLIDQERGSAR